MINEVKIHFKFESYKSFYFNKDEVKLIWGRKIRKSFMIAFISLILGLLSTYFFLATKNYILLIIIDLICSLMILNYFRILIPIIKWKKAVIQYLKELDKLVHFSYQFNENELICVMDNDRNCDNWNTFKRFKIEKDHIWLYGKNDYLFVSETMSSDDFEFISQFIRNKINQ